MDTDSHDVAGWTPVAEVAQRLGTTPLNVLMHIKRGLLIGVEREDGWLVAPESLATLIQQRAAGELPAVCQSGCSKNHGCQSCG